MIFLGYLSPAEQLTRIMPISNIMKYTQAGLFSLNVELIAFSGMIQLL
jgi:hypothetical protein